MSAHVDSLRKELEEARERYRIALAESREADLVFDDLGRQHPDGTQTLRNANRQLSLASLAFRRALSNFSSRPLPPRQRPEDYFAPAAETIGQRQPGSVADASQRLKKIFLNAQIVTARTLIYISRTEGALGFCEAAEESIAMARESYRTAVYWLEKMPLDPAERESAAARIDAIRRSLNEMTAVNPEEDHARVRGSNGHPHPAIAAAVRMAEYAEPAPFDVLTRRETEVLTLVAEGHSTKEIAARLGIAFKTAACHRTRIMAKLHAPNAAGLVRCAIRLGLVSL